MSADGTVYKIMTAPEWTAMQACGKYGGSADDIRDGFIHLSAASQVQGTLRKHFAGQVDLVLVAIDAGLLGKALRWEPSRGGDLFPHLYGDLPSSDVLWAKAIPLDEDGVYRMPLLEE